METGEMKSIRRIVLAWLLAGGLTPLHALAAEESDPAGSSPSILETPADRATRPDPAPPARARGKGIRTLDEITIEGEVAVPQVLFITARDRPRYEDRLHRRYLWGSLELGRATVLPEHLCILF
jgi:hypothetical protein